MFLVEQAQVPASVLPIEEFRAHLRLGTGFSDDTVQDQLLERTLRAATAQIENLCGKAVFRRTFVYTLNAWRDLSRQVLPRAPVTTLTELAIINLDGKRNAVSPTSYVLEADFHRPALAARGFVLPQIPIGGRAEIAFEAGYGASWSAIPPDLSVAVLSLAAALYEDRSANGRVPPGVASMLGPYRPNRLLGGF